MFFNFFGYRVCVCEWRGSQQKGWIHKLLEVTFTVSSSKIQSLEAYFRDIATTKNDHPKYVKHFEGSMYVFSILFGYWVRMCVWWRGVS